ncbi:PIN domain-containing protein [Planctomycetota bacterium]
MAKYLLDSNIVTCILRKRDEADFRIIRKFQDVLRTNARILICPIVFYEVARGLYHEKTRNHKKAHKQLGALEVFVEKFVWCEFDSETWDEGAKLWAKCRQNGKPTGDGLDQDVLIAAQVSKQDAILVTNNTKHFKHFSITHENWAS